MNFTDAVNVAGTPPVTPEHLMMCKRLLAEFALENDIPTPVLAEWFEMDGNVHFHASHDGRVFTIGAQKAH